MKIHEDVIFGDIVDKCYGLWVRQYYIIFIQVDIIRLKHPSILSKYDYIKFAIWFYIYDMFCLFTISYLKYK